MCLEDLQNISKMVCNKRIALSAIAKAKTHGLDSLFSPPLVV